MDQTPIRIFCGADRSQRLPYLVLADSIRRHSARDVQISAIDNGDAPAVDDPRCAPYTEFSFARFAIPALCDYRGHAVYMDSDMLVFRDIGELWDTPMQGAAVAIEQGSRSSAEQTAHARNRHAAVMLLDCGQLRWDVARIVARLGRDYDYNALMTVDPLIDSGQMRELIATGWNDLDRFDATRTRNLHFTEIRTQPWVNAQHPHGTLWTDALRTMLTEGAITAETVREEIELGYARPSLLRELGIDDADAGQLTPPALAAFDQQQGFVAHRTLLARFAQRKQAIARFERDQATGLKALWLRMKYRQRYGRD